MAEFKHRRLVLNVGQAIEGCAGFSGCGNFPNTCHVYTCFLNTRICGIPSCNFSGPIGCHFSLFQQTPADPVTLAQLKGDLQQAIQEVEALEKKQGKAEIDAAVEDLDGLAAEINALRADLTKRQKGS